jgi:hypothetical protein
MGNAIDHGLGGGGVAGHCCTLHAFLVGVASPGLISLFADLGKGERLEVGSDLFAGLAGRGTRLIMDRDMGSQCSAVIVGLFSA